MGKIRCRNDFPVGQIASSSAGVPFAGVGCHVAGPVRHRSHSPFVFMSTSIKEPEELKSIYTRRFEAMLPYRQRVWQVLVAAFSQRYVQPRGSAWPAANSRRTSRSNPPLGRRSPSLCSHRGILAHPKSYRPASAPLVLPTTNTQPTLPSAPGWRCAERPGRAWLTARHNDPGALSDRRGDTLTSSGDNDIMLCAMRAGWEVGYSPQLTLTHLIPAARLDADYLARLNRGIQKSWMRALSLHDANPWPPLSPLGAVLRKAKSWLTHRAWSSPAAHIRWQGACGHFDGRVTRD